MKTNPLRTKLINVMYLVLLAMLAINIQTDFIDTFFDLSSSLENSVEKSIINNDQKLKYLEDAYLNDSIFNKLSYEKSLLAYNISNNSIVYIDSLINLLLKKTGGFNEFGYPEKSISPNIPTNIFMENNVATDLKELLKKTRNDLTPILEKDSVLITNFLNVQDFVVNSIGKRLSWEEYHFNKVALGAAIAILSRFKNDIKMMESTIIDYYINNIYGDLSSFIMQKNSHQKISTFVENQKMFVLGDTIVFKTHEPKDLKSKKTLSKLNARGNIISTIDYSDNQEITYVAEESGDFIFQNEYFIENSSEPYFISKNFSVINPTNSKDSSIPIDQIIITENQETVYLGVYNSIELNYENIAFNNLKLTTNNGILNKEMNKYMLLPKKQGYCLVKLFYNNKNIAERTLIVKELPEPIAILDETLKSSVSSKIFRIQTALNLKVDPKFKNLYNIQSFNFSKYDKDGTRLVSLKNESAFFSKKTLKAVQSSRSGEMFVFSEIIVKSDDKRIREISPLVISIK